MAGVVNAPMLSTEYTAAVGDPAHLNDVPIRVNEAPSLAKAPVSTGFPYDFTQRSGVLQDISVLTTRVRDFRLINAAALDICGVAEGRTDAHVARSLPIWDYAAATLIADRAGAEVRITQEGPDRAELMVVASPSLVKELAPLL